jgi:hypothetical protein
LPSDRWILFTAGPQIGPAVLFWSWIPVILILSYGLSKITVTPLRMGQWFLLLLGLNQMDAAANIIIVAWLLALGWRGKMAQTAFRGWKFNAIQIILILLTVKSLFLLFGSINMGLLGSPDMHIRGGDSYGYYLRWYQDITGALLSQPLVISVSIWVYRVLMLIWALWLAFSLVSWLRWGWGNFTSGGYWHKVWKGKRPKTEAS